jgi:hypothetical protein
VADHAFKPRPLTDVNLVSEFGGVEDEEAFKAEGVSQHDYTYVPGASELRYNRDLALSALARGEIRAKEVPILPANVRWYRTVKGAGSDPDQMRVFHAKNQGYRAVTQSDLPENGKAKHPWLTALPPGAQIAPDGTIKSAAGDLQLFVIDQQGAAKNALRKKIATEEMVDGMQFGEGSLLKVGQQHKGSDPSITKLPSAPITVGGSK